MNLHGISKLPVGILVVLFPLVVAGFLDDNLPMESYVIVVTETDYTRSAGVGFDGKNIDVRGTHGHVHRYRPVAQKNKLSRSTSQLISPKNTEKPKLLERPMAKIQRRPVSQHNKSLLKDETNTDINISPSKTPSYWVNYLYSPQSTHDSPPQLAHGRSMLPSSDILLLHQSSAVSSTTANSRANVIDLVLTKKNDNPGFFKQGKFPDYDYFVNNILRIKNNVGSHKNFQ